MDQEEPEGPLVVPSRATPLGDQPGDTVVTELSEMKAIHALIWQLVPRGLCPPPPSSLVLRALPFFPSLASLFALFGVSDEPEAPAFVTTSGLKELPPLFSTEKAGHLMDAALRDAVHQGEGHLKYLYFKWWRSRELDSTCQNQLLA
jgi:hypothetical protein